MSTRVQKKRATAIDWDEVRRRLNAAAERSQRGIEARDRAVLQERARVLARPLTDELAATNRLELVIFTLTGERYALESRCVLQVVKLQDLVRMPGAPDHLLGLTNLRGEILPVFDLRALLGLSRARLDDLSRLLVLGDGEPELGILADAVLELERRRPDELLAAAEPIARADMPYLRGVTADALVVLDGAALLHDPRLFLNPTDSNATTDRG